MPKIEPKFKVGRKNYKKKFTKKCQRFQNVPRKKNERNPNLFLMYCKKVPTFKKVPKL